MFSCAPTSENVPSSIPSYTSLSLFLSLSHSFTTYVHSLTHSYNHSLKYSHTHSLTSLTWPIQSHTHIFRYYDIMHSYSYSFHIRLLARYFYQQPSPTTTVWNAPYQFNNLTKQWLVSQHFQTIYNTWWVTPASSTNQDRYSKRDIMYCENKTKEIQYKQTLCWLYFCDFSYSFKTKYVLFHTCHCCIHIRHK